MQTTWRASSSEQHYGVFRPSKSKAWIFVENAHVFFQDQIQDSGVFCLKSSTTLRMRVDTHLSSFCWKKTIQKRIFPTKSNIKIKLRSQATAAPPNAACASKKIRFSTDENWGHLFSSTASGLMKPSCFKGDEGWVDGMTSSFASTL